MANVDNTKESYSCEEAGDDGTKSLHCMDNRHDDGPWEPNRPEGEWAACYYQEQVGLDPIFDRNFATVCGLEGPCGAVNDCKNSIWCSYGYCEDMIFQRNNHVRCVSYACKGSKFTNSTVECGVGGHADVNYFSACNHANFKGSEVYCDPDCCFDASIQEGSEVSCEARNSCKEVESTDSAVTCGVRSGENTCAGASFARSNVTCDLGACEGAEFESSTVVCLRNNSCSTATFLHSGVMCSTKDSCNDVIFEDVCTCCDRIGCPPGAPSCTSDLEELCAFEYAGKSCAEHGLPVCLALSLPNNKTQADNGNTTQPVENGSRLNDAALRASIIVPSLTLIVIVAVPLCKYISKKRAAGQRRTSVAVAAESSQQSAKSSDEEAAQKEAPTPEVDAMAVEESISESNHQSVISGNEEANCA